MKKFSEWMKSKYIESNSNIVINLDNFYRLISKSFEETLKHLKDNKTNATTFNVDEFFQYIQTTFKNYPDLPNLLNILKSKNQSLIFNQIKELRNWLLKSNLRVDLTKPIYSGYLNYLDHLNPDFFDTTKIKNEYENIRKKTELNFENLKRKIQSFISEGSWKGTPLTIVAEPARDVSNNILLQPSNDAQVYFGTGEYAPTLTLFEIDSNIMVEDILEAGDTDFFTNSNVQTDYFSLVEFLRNPERKSKKIKLYTARPTSDRNFYLKTTTAPANIFLSNNIDDAHGIGIDFGKRDIWKVTLDSKFLIQTLDGPIKHYQLIQEVPATFELIIPSE